MVEGRFSFQLMHAREKKINLIIVTKRVTLSLKSKLNR